MNFCGYCGSLLVPGSPTCPRCGATNDSAPPFNLDGVNNATISTNPPFATGSPAKGETATGFSPLDLQPPPQPPFVVNYSQDHGYPGAQAAEDSTLPTNIPWRGYSQNEKMPSTPFPNASSSWIDASAPINPLLTNNQPIGYAGYQPSQTPYPAQVPETFTPQTSPHRRKGLIALLIVVACILVLITGVVAFFVTHGQQQNLHMKTTVTTQVVATATPTPSQLAQAALHRYFGDINEKDYSDAYGLWINPSQPYTRFASGFANTLHDNSTFNNIVLQSNGTVKIAITIVAEEQSASSGIQYSIYSGYYIMMQRSSGWKIATAHIDKV